MLGKAEFIVAVCDDNAEVRKKVRTVVEEMLSQENFLCSLLEFSCAEDVLAYISSEENRHIELLYLDIEMQGMSGLELMQHLIESKSVWRIVFVTSHSESILNSFSIKTIGFIIKPIAEEEINKKLQFVLQEWKKNKSFMCKDINRQYQVFKYDTILYFEADRNYCKINYINENTQKLESMLLEERVGELEKRLANMDFIRIHKSFLVNLSYINSIRDRVEIYNGQVSLPIGRNYKEMTKHALLKYVAGKVWERI